MSVKRVTRKRKIRFVWEKRGGLEEYKIIQGGGVPACVRMKEKEELVPKEKKMTKQSRSSPRKETSGGNVPSYRKKVSGGAANKGLTNLRAEGKSRY